MPNRTFPPNLFSKRQQPRPVITPHLFWFVTHPFWIVVSFFLYYCHCYHCDFVPTVVVVVLVAVVDARGLVVVLYADPPLVVWYGHYRLRRCHYLTCDLPKILPMLWVAMMTEQVKMTPQTNHLLVEITAASGQGQVRAQT